MQGDSVFPERDRRETKRRETRRGQERQRPTAPRTAETRPPEEVPARTGRGPTRQRRDSAGGPGVIGTPSPRPSLRWAVRTAGLRARALA